MGREGQTQKKDVTDQNQTELGVLVLAVALKVLSHKHINKVELVEDRKTIRH